MARVVIGRPAVGTRHRGPGSAPALGLCSLHGHWLPPGKSQACELEAHCEMKVAY